MPKKTKEPKVREILPPTKKIGAALKPFGLDQPYELGLRIQQGRWLLKQEVGIHLALGCILLEIREREDFQTFGKVTGDEFGLAKSAAYNYMAFAKKCMDLPKLKTFAEDNWSKAVALLDGCTDEQLREIEKKGIEGQALDEFDGMSVREFKACIKSLQTDVQKRIEKEVKNQVKENQKLEKENAYLRSRLPEDGYDWVQSQRPYIAEAYEEFLERWRYFALNKESELNDFAQEFMVEFYDRIFSDLDSIDETRYEKTGRRYTRRKK